MDVRDATRSLIPEVNKIIVVLLAAAVVASFFVALFASPAEARHHHRHHHRHHSPASVSPTTLNFGDVTVGTPKSLDLTVKNNGTKPITIPVDAVSGNGFAIDPTVTLPKSIASGDSVTVPVIFTPLEEGVSTGSLIIVNVDGKTIKTVPLTGTGVLPI